MARSSVQAGRRLACASSPRRLVRRSVGQEGVELGCPRGTLDADSGGEEDALEDDSLEVVDIRGDDNTGAVGESHDDVDVEGVGWAWDREPEMN